ncbi:MAG: 6-carboxytetrahydropterin synthase [Calditrichaeota bacterium]|nr:6-carboxytetrahydropterin synthase [Calditrichota bacterium]
MQKVTISRKFEFSASHRYWRDEWSEEKNNNEFGLCTSPYGHGHNYELHVTITGNIDPKTGMIVNLTVLKARVKNILNQFDHKFLNLDTPYFKDKIPTTENIAVVLFDLIEKDLSRDGYELVRIRLYERHDLYSDVWK